MSIRDILAIKKTLSFEFCPPRKNNTIKNIVTEMATADHLNAAFLSITYGAGGKTHEGTVNLIEAAMKAGLKARIVPHLTCIASTVDDINQIMDHYVHDVKINDVLALRGDIPKNNKSTGGDFQYAVDLVHHIRSRYPGMSIGVAGYPERHPESPTWDFEMDMLKAKVDAGSDYIVTQLFFDVNDFERFLERCHARHINVPIIAGLMPILSIKRMRRIIELSGAKIPNELYRQISAHDDVRKVGIAWAKKMYIHLQQIANGLHLYTLNNVSPWQEIIDASQNR